MDDILTQMGQRIRKHREESHMTQEKLAELVDISTQTISTAETGKNGCALKISLKYARPWVSAPTTCSLGKYRLKT